MIKNYNMINILGTILWIVGYLMAEKGLYPYCYLGLFTAPIVLLIGILAWARYYIKTKRKLLKPTNANPNEGLYFGLMRYFFNHIPEFWTFCIIIWICAVFILTFSFKNTAEYDLAIDYIKNDSLGYSKIGTFKSTGLLIEGNISQNDTSRLYMQVIGEKKTLDVDVKILENNNSLKVINIKYK